MEWWQIFLLLFVFVTVMFYVSSYKEKSARSTRPRKKGQVTVMNNNQNYDDEWNHPGGLASTPPKGDLQRFGNSEDQSDEHFLLKVPREINKRINQGQVKKTLKGQVEIGKLQVEHIKNANEFYDEAFKLQNKEKTHQLNSLDLDHKIQVKKSDIDDQHQQRELKNLRNQAERLDLQIGIAEKQARLNQLQNPAPPPKAEPGISVKEQLEREELKLSKLKRERLGALMEILNNREYDAISEDEQARYDETSIEYDSRIHALKEKIEKLRSRAE